MTAPSWNLQVQDIFFSSSFLPVKKIVPTQNTTWNDIALRLKEYKNTYVEVLFYFLKY